MREREGERVFLYLRSIFINSTVKTCNSIIRKMSLPDVSCMIQSSEWRERFTRPTWHRVRHCQLLLSWKQSSFSSLNSRLILYSKINKSELYIATVVRPKLYFVIMKQKCSCVCNEISALHSKYSQRPWHVMQACSHWMAYLKLMGHCFISSYSIVTVL